MIDAPYLLDTNVVLTLIRGNALAAVIDQRFGLRASKVRPFVCVVSHGELRVLAGRHGWGEPKLAALHNALANLVTVDINHPEVLDAYVKIDLYSQRHPDGARNMGKNDLWIAACAKATGATLLTTDSRRVHRRRRGSHRRRSPRPRSPWRWHRRSRRPRGGAWSPHPLSMQ